jgi:hypothetical protein
MRECAAVASLLSITPSDIETLAEKQAARTRKQKKEWNRPKKMEKQEMEREKREQTRQNILWQWQKRESGRKRQHRRQRSGRRPTFPTLHSQEIEEEPLSYACGLLRQRRGRHQRQLPAIRPLPACTTHALVVTGAACS